MADLYCRHMYDRGRYNQINCFLFRMKHSYLLEYFPYAHMQTRKRKTIPSKFILGHVQNFLQMTAAPPIRHPRVIALIINQL